ncbi:solute carrier family 22 member 4 [Plakobranchus ocellatus]|uniref:Solute carrier family 22 member 4 n=1 Tax=Plakobranchus ocellatus TaxID=259542 RepID=A0AAV3YY83_9GAST|nr:solute carrier family 22 member 4 [Plakobranchus ocellatus]
MEGQENKEESALNQEETDTLHVDQILRALNPRGRYQILHIVLVLLSIPTAGFQLFSNVFIAKNVPHKCAGPPESSGWSDIFSDTGNLTIVQGKCRLLLTDNSSVLDSVPCVYGHQYQLPEDASVVSQFDLVCEMDWLARLSQTMVIVGQGLGAVLNTFLSDRFGRKTVLVSSSFGLLSCGLAAAYAPNAIVFVVFKFLIGGFQQGVVALATTFILEVLPLEYRATQSWLSGCTWGFGVMLLAPIAFFFKDSSWWSLQRTLSLVSLVGILQLCFMDESLRWLIVNGKTKQAEKVIKRIAKMNKRSEVTILEQFREKLVLRDKNDVENSEDSGKVAVQDGSQRLSLLDILKVKRLLFNSACLWFCWFTAALSFFTIYLTATSLSGDPYLNFGLTALMELPSNAFFFFCLNRLGRRRCLQTVFAVMGTGVVLAGMFKKLEESNSMFSVFTLLASLTAMCGASGCFTLVFSYTPEMFPTNLRSQAIGVCSFFSRIGGMLGPFAGWLAEVAVWAPGVTIGICACVVCLLALFLPETSKRELPQTISDLQAWFKSGQSWHEKRRNVEIEIDPIMGANGLKPI